jgi:hypothetical protein
MFLQKRTAGVAPPNDDLDGGRTRAHGPGVPSPRHGTHRNHATMTARPEAARKRKPSRSPACPRPTTSATRPVHPPTTTQPPASPPHHPPNPPPTVARDSGQGQWPGTVARDRTPQAASEPGARMQITDSNTPRARAAVPRHAGSGSDVLAIVPVTPASIWWIAGTRWLAVALTTVSHRVPGIHRAIHNPHACRATDDRGARPAPRPARRDPTTATQPPRSTAVAFSGPVTSAGPPCPVDDYARLDDLG